MSHQHNTQISMYDGVIKIELYASFSANIPTSSQIGLCISALDRYLTTINPHLFGQAGVQSNTGAECRCLYALLRLARTIYNTENSTISSTVFRHPAHVKLSN